MRRYWMAGSLLLLAGVAGFWLPSVMMEWQDEARIGKIETERAEEVILTVQTEMSLLEKLNLMTGGTVNTLE
ncbi:MAG: hypothetical protein J6D13_06640, partial [Clostridium sp.]|nr:hypothetical protein [Clostridium sp.]